MMTGQLRPRTYAAGDWVVDTRDDRAAVVKHVRDGRLYLRCPGGGVEWQAVPAQVRPATDSEALSAKVAERNAQSWGGRLW